MYSRGSPISLKTNNLVSLIPENLSVVGNLSGDCCIAAYVSTHNVVLKNLGVRIGANKGNDDSLGTDFERTRSGLPLCFASQGCPC